jgi:hypothetical protein
MNLEAPLEAHAQSTETGKLRIRALDEPAMSSESLRNSMARLC